MRGYRPERVAELIHRELGQRLLTEIKDPRVTPISITHVQVNRDLSRAVIQFLPLGGGTVSPDLIDGLDHAARQLRGPIGRALRLRHAPELVFEVDTHTEEAVRMTQILDEIGEELRQGEDAETGDEE
ncbi:MAG: 30S ribosome-binding factor RbfA [Myxococcota bacterium]